MIYTSYFGNICNFTPIAICGKTPERWLQEVGSKVGIF